MLIIFTALLLTGGFAVVMFVSFSPQFGQTPRGADLERIRKSPHHTGKKFENLTLTTLGSFGEMMGTLPDFIFSKNGAPDKPLPVMFGEYSGPSADSVSYVTWFGHSAFLIETDGLRLLIDPMLGETAAPVSFGSSRFPYEKPLPLDDLTGIDAVILSHDHYDHLDYESILMLSKENPKFFVPLGVGSHLKRWGIRESDITELDWWQEAAFGDMTFIATPARHFSGRGLTDRNSTFWASWVIRGKYQTLFFSGDGGYGDHFKEIGQRFGPFDLAMIECGQYNEAWKDIHMMPEQSVAAGADLNAKRIMPIHWGAFKLAVHEWTDPITRFKAEAERVGMPVVHPFIGQRFGTGSEHPFEDWWIR